MRDYGPQNTDADVVGAGTYLTELLRQRGWNVIHDTTAYDRKEGKLERSRAYAYALEGVQGIYADTSDNRGCAGSAPGRWADSVRLTEISMESLRPRSCFSRYEPHAGGRDRLSAQSASAGKPCLFVFRCSWPVDDIRDLPEKFT